MKLTHLSFREHDERDLRHALGSLVASFGLDDYPKEADLLLDAIIEAVVRRQQANQCRCR